MWSIFSKVPQDPKDLFKKCKKCSDPLVCDANLNVIRNESKVQDWHLSIGRQAAATLFIALQSLSETDQNRFRSSDKVVSLDLLKSLAKELNWCNNDCKATGSKLKVDIIEDIRDEIGNNTIFEKCPKCKRTTVSKKNLWIIRAGVSLGFMTTLGGIGALMLPLLGFGAGGIAAGSTAAAWQSSLGSVAAGSLFATLQSLGATGLGVLLFGSTGSALGLLGSLAVKLDWCTGDCVTGKSEKCGKDSSKIVNEPQLNFVKLQVTITKIADLTSLQSPDFDLGNGKYNIKVFRESDCLNIGINSNTSCKLRGIVELLGINENIKSIKRSFIEAVTPNDGVALNKFISWNLLANRNDRFVQYGAITIEIKIRVKDEATKHPLLLDCAICLEDIKSQELSSVPCGHIFCTTCIEKSLKSKTKCPVCETSAYSKDLRRIFLPV